MTVESRTLFVDSVPRAYRLHRPTGNRMSGRSLVVVLHGTGGTADWAEDETGWSHTADQEGFLLVLPQGLPPNPAMPPRFLSNPPRWNDGATKPGDLLHTETDDVAFLDALLDDVLIRDGVDPHRVYLTGFSNGAGMTFRYAAERSERLAAIAPVAGYCWIREPCLTRPIPTLFIVGEADPLIPLTVGTVRLPWGNRIVERPGIWDTLRRWAAANSCDHEPHVLSESRSVTTWQFPGHVDYRVLTLAGHGHHWPGGKGQLNPRIGGIPTDTLDANARIWAFFSHGT
ncbi:MAG: hypothetical protein LC104_00590 [Bacteroidales bacterium]|nr:hypothetical protein [Bacteroidales bacterium]